LGYAAAVGFVMLIFMGLLHEQVTN